jgi:hypothetical protein
VVENDPVKKTTVAKMQPVKIALSEGQLTILDSGVQPGQNVVVDGADRLRAGQIVIANAAKQHGGQGAAQTTGQAAGQPAGHGAVQPGSGKGNWPKKEQQ